MIEMEMSRDIQDYSPKVVSIFNRRQLICVSIAAAYGLPLFFALGDMDLTLKMSIVAVLVTPPIACGWVEMYGLPLERFFTRCIIPMWFSPRKRKYITKNPYGFLGPDAAKPVTFKDIPKKKLRRKERKARRAAIKKYNGKA